MKPREAECSVRVWVRARLLILTNRVPNEKDQKVLRFVGRTNANIILTLSRPIRVSESDFQH